MSIAVTGASGQLGKLVSAQLLNIIEPTEVVLLSRSPESLSEFAGRGAHIRRADFDDPTSLTDAFSGVEKLLLISADSVGDRVAGHIAVIKAAAAAGVGHVAYTSVPQPVPANPALVVRDHSATEDALCASGLGWTFLRNNLYADMQLAAIAQAASSGTLVTNVGEGRAAYVTREDCAAAAVAVLTSQAAENIAYDITGPQALTAQDLAHLAGPSVQVLDIDDAAYESGLVGAGIPAHIAKLLTAFGVSIREGFLSAASSSVYDLTGRQPAPLKALLPR